MRGLRESSDVVKFTVATSIDVPVSVTKGLILRPLQFNTLFTSDDYETSKSFVENSHTFPRSNDRRHSSLFNVVNINVRKMNFG